MADYIDRDTVLDKLHEIGGCDAPPDTWADGFDKAIDEAYRAVQGLTTADVAPVVHGRWTNNTGGFYEVASCSICGERRITTGITPNYCPNCGAKMDGGD